MRTKRKTQFLSGSPRNLHNSRGVMLYALCKREMAACCSARCRPQPQSPIVCNGHCYCVTARCMLELKRCAPEYSFHHSNSQMLLKMKWPDPVLSTIDSFLVFKFEMIFSEIHEWDRQSICYCSVPDLKTNKKKSEVWIKKTHLSKGCLIYKGDL